MTDIGGLVSELATRVAKDLDHNLIAILQIGSSLYDDVHFTTLSDVDLYAIVKRKVRDHFRILHDYDREVQLTIRSRRQFLEALRKGFPLELTALYYGRLLHGEQRFLAELRGRFGPTPNTVEQWLTTATRRYSFALMSYDFPACACCFMNDLYHATRECLRAVILKEEGVFVEMPEELLFFCEKMKLKKDYLDLLKIRNRWEELADHVPREKVLQRIKVIKTAEKIFGDCYQMLRGQRLPTIAELLSIARRLSIKRPEFALNFEGGRFTGGHITGFIGRKHVIADFDEALKAMPPKSLDKKSPELSKTR